MSGPTPARSLDEAIERLHPRPLEADEEVWYVERPHDHEHAPRALDVLLDRLVHAAPSEKLFLSGHVGSGKSTELRRLERRPEIRAKFAPIHFALEEHERAHLDSRSFLFRVAAVLFKWGTENQRLGSRASWSRHLELLDRALFGPTGIKATDGVTRAKFNLFFIEVQQELKLSENRRRQFRELGETELSALRDLVASLIDDLEDELARHQEPARLLIVVDDLDKVRDPERQRDLFETNLDTILAPPVTMLMTLPASVLFTGRGRALRAQTTYLRPAPVLRRVAASKPEEARDDRGVAFLVAAANKRLASGLFEDSALRRAALYSGGVAREFFLILREAARNAKLLRRSKVDDLLMMPVITQSAVQMSFGLYAGDLAALARVRKEHQLAGIDESRYLDLSWVLELNGDELWFEVHPLLWSKLS